MQRLTTQLRVLGIILLVAASLFSAPQKPYSKHDKAFFLPDATVQFVRPGLTITVNSAKVASDGTITVLYTLTDPNGLPLDSAGVTTPGTISVSYVAAMIPNKGQEQYTAYTTTRASGTVIATTQQPGADSGGVDHRARDRAISIYVFKTKAPSGFDATATHTIGIYGSRNLTAYSLPNNYASATYNFVPNGAKVTKMRDVIETASCNACHDQLSAHGGSRRGLNMCVLCHTPQNIDPNTGADAGRQGLLPQAPHGRESAEREGRHSICSGDEFSFGTLRLFDSASFPADPGDPRRCETCHSQTDRRRAGDGVSDQSDARGLRLLPRRCELRHRRESPGRPAVRRQPVRQLPHPAGRNGFRRVDHGRARGADGVDVCSRD